MIGSRKKKKKKNQRGSLRNSIRNSISNSIHGSKHGDSLVSGISSADKSVVQGVEIPSCSTSTFSQPNSSVEAISLITSPPLSPALMSKTTTATATKQTTSTSRSAKETDGGIAQSCGDGILHNVDERRNESNREDSRRRRSRRGNEVGVTTRKAAQLFQADVNSAQQSILLGSSAAVASGRRPPARATRVGRLGGGSIQGLNISWSHSGSSSEGGSHVRLRTGTSTDFIRDEKEDDEGTKVLNAIGDRINIDGAAVTRRRSPSWSSSLSSTTNGVVVIASGSIPSGNESLRLSSRNIAAVGAASSLPTAFQTSSLSADAESNSLSAAYAASSLPAYALLDQFKILVQNLLVLGKSNRDNNNTLSDFALESQSHEGRINKKNTATIPSTTFDDVSDLHKIFKDLKPFLLHDSDGSDSSSSTASFDGGGAGGVWGQHPFKGIHRQRMRDTAQVGEDFRDEILKTMGKLVNCLLSEASILIESQTTSTGRFHGGHNRPMSGSERQWRMVGGMGTYRFLTMVLAEGARLVRKVSDGRRIEAVKAAFSNSGEGETLQHALIAVDRLNMLPPSTPADPHEMPHSQEMPSRTSKEKRHARNMEETSNSQSAHSISDGKDQQKQSSQGPMSSSFISEEWADLLEWSSNVDVFLQQQQRQRAKRSNSVVILDERSTSITEIVPGVFSVNAKEAKNKTTSVLTAIMRARSLVAEKDDDEEKGEEKEEKGKQRVNEETKKQHPGNKDVWEDRRKSSPAFSGLSGILCPSLEDSLETMLLRAFPAICVVGKERYLVPSCSLLVLTLLNVLLRCLRFTQLEASVVAVAVTFSVALAATNSTITMLRIGPFFTGRHQGSQNDAQVTLPFLPEGCVTRDSLVSGTVKAILGEKATLEVEDEDGDTEHGKEQMSIRSLQSDPSFAQNGVVIIHGKSGTGTTTLAKMVAHDTSIKRHFGDGGMAWLSLEQEAITYSGLIDLYNNFCRQVFSGSSSPSPDVLERLGRYYLLLPPEDDKDALVLMEEMKMEVYRLISSTNRPILIVLDNVWIASDVKWFLFGSNSEKNNHLGSSTASASVSASLDNPCQLLITTSRSDLREDAIFRVSGVSRSEDIEVGPLSDEEAVALLLKESDNDVDLQRMIVESDDTREIIKLCENTPSNLKLVARIASERLDRLEDNFEYVCYESDDSRRRSEGDSATADTASADAGLFDPLELWTKLKNDLMDTSSSTLSYSFSFSSTAPHDVVEITAAASAANANSVVVPRPHRFLQQGFRSVCGDASDIIRLCFSAFLIVFADDPHRKHPLLRPFVPMRVANLLWEELLLEGDDLVTKGHVLALERLMSISQCHPDATKRIFTRSEMIRNRLEALDLIQVVSKKEKNGGRYQDEVGKKSSERVKNGYAIFRHGNNNAEHESQSIMYDSIHLSVESCFAPSQIDNELAKNHRLYNGFLVSGYEKLLRDRDGDAFNANSNRAQVDEEEDHYFARWLPLHMVRAGLLEKVVVVLTDIQFVRKRFQVLGPVTATRQHILDAESLMTYMRNMGDYGYTSMTDVVAKNNIILAFELISDQLQHCIPLQPLSVRDKCINDSFSSARGAEEQRAELGDDLMKKRGVSRLEIGICLYSLGHSLQSNGWKNEGFAFYQEALFTLNKVDVHSLALHSSGPGEDQKMLNIADYGSSDDNLNVNYRQRLMPRTLYSLLSSSTSFLGSLALAVGNDDTDRNKEEEVAKSNDDCSQKSKFYYQIMSRVFYSLGGVFELKGDRDEAIKSYEDALFFGKDASRGGGNVTNSDIARIYSRLGIVHYDHGNYEQAIHALKESLLVRRSIGPGDSVGISRIHGNCSNEGGEDVAKTMVLLGFCYRELNQREEALNSMTESLRIRHDLYSSELLLPFSSSSSLSALAQQHGESNGNDDMQELIADVGRTLHSMGKLQEELGRLDEAIESYTQALRFRRKALGKTHIEYGHTLHCLGVTLQKHGSLEDALTAYTKAFVIRRNAWGLNHVDVATTLHHLGVVYCEMGNYDEALASYTEALRLRKLLLGDHHRDSAMTLHNIGVVHKEKGDTDQALKAFTEALWIAKDLNINAPSAEAIKKRCEVLFGKRAVDVESVCARIFGCVSIMVDRIVSNKKEITDEGGIKAEDEVRDAEEEGDKDNESSLSSFSPSSICQTEAPNEWIQPLLPLLKAIVEVEVCVLDGGNVVNPDATVTDDDEDDANIDIGDEISQKDGFGTQKQHDNRRRKVQFCAYDYSSVSPPVDMNLGSHEHLVTCIRALRSVMNETQSLISRAHAMANVTGTKTMSPEHALGKTSPAAVEGERKIERIGDVDCSTVGGVSGSGGGTIEIGKMLLVLHAMSSENDGEHLRKACSMAMPDKHNQPWPTSRFRRAANIYTAEFETLAARLETTSPPSYECSSITPLRYRLGAWIGSGIRFHLRRLFDYPPMGYTIPPEDMPFPDFTACRARTYEIVTMCPPDKFPEGSSGEEPKLWESALSVVFNLGLRHVHAYLTLSDTIRAVFVTPREQANSTMSPNSAANIPSSSMGGFFYLSEASRRTLERSTQKPLTISDVDDILNDIHLARIALAASRAAEFLTNLFSWPDVHDCINEAGGWNDIEEIASIIQSYELGADCPDESHYTLLSNVDEFRNLLKKEEECINAAAQASKKFLQKLWSRYKRAGLRKRMKNANESIIRRALVDDSSTPIFPCLASPD